MKYVYHILYYFLLNKILIQHYVIYILVKIALIFIITQKRWINNEKCLFYSNDTTIFKLYYKYYKLCYINQ